MANPPARPLASRPSSASSSSHSSSQESDGGLEVHAQQAGRSVTSLAAQRSAQSLREAARFSLPPPPRSKSPTRQHNVLKKQRPQAENLAPPSTQRRHSLFTPYIPSPLNPTTAATSASAPTSRKGSKEAVDEASAAAHHPILTQQRSLPLRPTFPRIRMPDGHMREAPRPDLARLRTPRSVRDLGADYTRYFNPFVPSNNPFRPLQSRPSATRLNAGNGIPPSTKGTAASQISNPFHDNQRMSNPFASAEDVTISFERKDASVTVDGSESPTASRSTSARSSSPTFIHNVDLEKMPFFLYLDDRLGAPDNAFPLITDEKEDDDDLHMPQWDDDIRLKPRWKDHFTRGNMSSTIGLLLMALGLLCIFVVLPILSYAGIIFLDNGETPLDQFPYYAPAQPWSFINNKHHPLLQNVRTGLIDPDTPQNAMTKTGINGETFNLVFSDEFNVKNRTFYPGDDAYWTGFNGWYGATQDLEWYDPDALNTGDGMLLIQMDKFPNHNLDFRSGMMNSWNQVCMKGGILEVSVSLPGPAGVHGLWPGMWTMGNLGRPGYLATTDGLWPYTYNECDAGITPNQSSTDGISELPGQRLPSCTCLGEDHPTPGVGRGAPEIDIAEVSASWGTTQVGVATQSYQVAPFDIWYYPDYRFMQNPDYNLSLVNSWTGGPFQQAVSTTSMLNNNWYDQKEFQTFQFEYAPGIDENAYVAWSIGGEEMMKFDARAVGPNGNIGQRIISEEPMSIILNLGISNNWVSIDWAALEFPTVMSIDYVRWYQLESEYSVTCDPPGYETTEYIAQHPKAYLNVNNTKWEHTGYPWPKNSFMDGCST